MRRNGYGRQVDSFETDLDVAGLGADGSPGPFHAVFIRAPRVERVGPAVEVLAEHDGVPVLARQGAVTVAAFHPELSGDGRAARPVPAGGAEQMSGHSKWATIKHQKGAKDKARGKLFAKLIRQVEVAAREGGGDLRGQRDAAHDGAARPRPRPMPNDTIERAIKRGTGELEGVTYEAITYEGYAPGGVAVLIDVLTDNRNRTGAEIRSMLHASSAARWPSRARSAWQFARTGRGLRAAAPSARTT